MNTNMMGANKKEVCCKIVLKNGKEYKSVDTYANVCGLLEDGNPLMNVEMLVEPLVQPFQWVCISKEDICAIEFNQ